MSKRKSQEENEVVISATMETKLSGEFSMMRQFSRLVVRLSNIVMVISLVSNLFTPLALAVELPAHDYASDWPSEGDYFNRIEPMNGGETTIIPNEITSQGRHITDDAPTPYTAISSRSLETTGAAIPNAGLLSAPNPGRLPLSFVPNAGQLDPVVQFQAHGLGGTIFFTPEEIVLSLPTPTKPPDIPGKAEPQIASRQKSRSPVRPASIVHLRFEGANPKPEIGSGARLPGIVNYFIGHDPEKWQTNLPTYASIIYHDLYPGIDLRYAGLDGGLKGTYVIAPGADPRLIRWSYEGATTVQIDPATGNLLVEVPYPINSETPEKRHTLTESAPVAWQEIEGQRILVAIKYTIDEKAQISFDPGSYNPAYPLIVDPTLEYSTYFGGSNGEEADGIAVDGEGNMYITGLTNSLNFPSVNPIASYGGQYDGFVTKLNAMGDTIIYSTYIGGSADDWDLGIVLDSVNNVYIVGSTESSDFPLMNPFQSNLGGSDDAFVAKLDANGNALIYSTYLGGGENEKGYDIALDNNNNVYITGYTLSDDFPTTATAFQTSCGDPDPSIFCLDAFVTKLDSTGSFAHYSTYLGGESDDAASSIAVDSNGNAYLTGETLSANFPTTPASFQSTHPTGGSAHTPYVTKLNTTGEGLVYSTYLGGENTGGGWDIAVDSNGNAYVTGYTYSEFFPTLNPVQPNLSGWDDAFVAKLNTTGDALIYSTFLGGGTEDVGRGIAIDDLGNVSITGNTLSSDFPTINAIHGDRGDYDAFVTQVDSTGSFIRYSTYLGGNDYDIGLSIAVDNIGNTYVSGGTLSTDFPTANPLQASLNGTADAFVVKLAPENLVTVEVIQPEGGAEITWGVSTTIRVRVDDSNSGQHELSIPVNLIYLDTIDPVTQEPREEEILLGYVSTTEPWDYYEVDWTLGYPGEVLILVVMGSVNDSVTVTVACPPTELLSHIGQAMSEKVHPAIDNCGSTFEDLFIIENVEGGQTGPDGTVPFAEFGNLARNAKYEVLFTSMHWSPQDLSPGQNEAARLFFEGENGDSGLLRLYNEVKQSYDNNNLSNYPYGMTVRILMGFPSGVGSTNKEVVLQGLSARGIPLYYPDTINPYWKVEVADYRSGSGLFDPLAKFHSHVKTMIVDGETVIVGGYNMQNVYFATEVEPGEQVQQDMGIKLFGDIAQESLKVFDNLWQKAVVCTEYDIIENECTEEKIAGIEISMEHPAPVTNNPRPGTNLNAFPLYRDHQNHQAEDAVYKAMAASTSQINIMQDRVLYAAYGPQLKYMLGILKALANGSRVRYIFNCEPWGSCRLNIESYELLKSYLAEIDQQQGTNFADNLEAKTIRLERYKRRDGKKFLHTKALSIDGVTLIVGSMNFDFSSWGDNTTQNLAEYDLAIDYNTPSADSAPTIYNEYFESEWNDEIKYIPVDDIIAQDYEPGTQTLQAFIDQVAPNSIVVIPEGIHQESVVINKPLEIIGADTQKTIIEPPIGQPAFRLTSSDVSIYNLTVRNSADYGIELIDSSSNSLENIFIKGILFEDNAQAGVLVEGLILGSPINYTLENNTFIGGQQGIRINVLEQQTISSTIRNNIFFDQSVVPIKTDSANDGGVDYGYNLFNNCVRAVNGVCPTDWYDGTFSPISNAYNNLLNLDPGFSDPVMGDYTLLPTSPLIDTGDPETVNEVGLDGYTPGRADIGAFETELVTDPPGDFFQETGGQVVMEVEHATWNLRHGRQVWVSQTKLANYTGSGYLSTPLDIGSQFNTPSIIANPELQYTINFTITGTYILWLRGYGSDAAGDSVYVGFDNQPLTMLTGFTPRTWSWASKTLGGQPLTVEITEPGLHTLHLWMREDGLRLDRILLTTDSGYQPVGNGPAESDRLTFSEYIAQFIW